MNQLSKIDIETLKNYSVNVDGQKMTGFEILQRISSPMIDEGNYNYFVNCASTHAVIERIFKAAGV